VRKLIILLLGLLIYGSAVAGLKPGVIPPDYLGKTLTGKPVHLSALRGKIVVISFWATWCHYCLKELPTLAGLQSIATRRGLRMQVVAVDYEEPRRTFVHSAHVLKPHLPGLLLTWDGDGRIGKPYGVYLRILQLTRLRQIR
jgi:thiol-disulfide isomerase/thioredoxin